MHPNCVQPLPPTAPSSHLNSPPPFYRRIFAPFQSCGNPPIFCLLSQSGGGEVETHPLQWPTTPAWLCKSHVYYGHGGTLRESHHVRIALFFSSAELSPSPQTLTPIQDFFARSTVRRDFTHLPDPSSSPRNLMIYSIEEEP